MTEHALPILHFRSEFLPNGDFPSDYYQGSAWRGALGYALKATNPDLFHMLYSDDTEEAKQHPLVLSPIIANSHKAESLCLDIILCGNLTIRYRDILAALVAAAEKGLYGIPLAALSLRQFDPVIGWHTCDSPERPPLPPFDIRLAPTAPASTVMHLLHPLRIKGKSGIMKPERFTPIDLLTRILRRHHNLLYDWCGNGLADWQQCR